MSIKYLLLCILLLGIISCSSSEDTLPDGNYEIIDIQTESPDILNKTMHSLPSFHFSGNMLKVCNGDLAGFFTDSIYSYWLKDGYMYLQSDSQKHQIAIEPNYLDNIFKLWIINNGIKLIHIGRQ